MPDSHTPEQRHNNMSAIHGRDTRPEMVVRRYLWNHGFRYRLNHRRLPGRPDVVLRKYRTCIFVNGCFWHGHEGCRYYTVPRTNTTFWVNKVRRNQQRDAEVIEKLQHMGWNCITIWECELRPASREKTLSSLALTLSQILLGHSAIRRYHLEEEETEIRQRVADEAEPIYTDKGNS